MSSSALQMQSERENPGFPTKLSSTIRTSRRREERLVAVEGIVQHYTVPRIANRKVVLDPQAPIAT